MSGSIWASTSGLKVRAWPSFLVGAGMISGSCRAAAIVPAEPKARPAAVLLSLDKVHWAVWGGCSAWEAQQGQLEGLRARGLLEVCWKQGQPQDGVCSTHLFRKKTPLAQVEADLSLHLEENSSHSSCMTGISLQERGAGLCKPKELIIPVWPRSLQSLTIDLTHWRATIREASWQVW